jgi:hypothetical protein
MMRAPGCNCLCDPPDCLGCSPTWINNEALPVKATVGWTPPSWGMPLSSEDVISSIALYNPSCEGQRWNCGTWTPTPVYCGCGTPFVSGTLTTRWYDGPTADISGSQELWLEPNRCAWSASKPKYLNHYSHNGYISKTSPDGLMGGGPVQSAPPAWFEEIIDAVNTAGSGDPPVWTDPGTDSFASLWGTTIDDLWSLNPSKPHDHGNISWSRVRQTFGWGVRLNSGRHTDGSFRWSLGVSLVGTRSWKFEGTILTGPYAGHSCGSSYGAALNVQHYGAVSVLNASKQHGPDLSWLNEPFAVHPTYEQINQIAGSPTSHPPAVYMPPGVSLPYAAYFFYTSDEVVSCDVDFQDELEIEFSLTPGREAILAQYAAVFGLSIPSTLTVVFEPNP